MASSTYLFLFPTLQLKAERLPFRFIKIRWNVIGLVYSSMYI